MDKFKTKAITSSLSDMGVFDIYSFDIDNNITHKNMLVLKEHRGMIIGFNKIMPYFKSSKKSFDSDEVATILRKFIEFYIQRIDKAIFYKEINSNSLNHDELAFDLTELISNQSNFFNLIYQKKVKIEELNIKVKKLLSVGRPPIEIFNEVLEETWGDKSKVSRESLADFKSLYEQW